MKTFGYYIPFLFFVVSVATNTPAQNGNQNILMAHQVDSLPLFYIDKRQVTYREMCKLVSTTEYTPEDITSKIRNSMLGFGIRARHGI